MLADLLGGVSISITDDTESMVGDPRRRPRLVVGVLEGIRKHGHSVVYALIHRTDPAMNDRAVGMFERAKLRYPAEGMDMRREGAQLTRIAPPPQCEDDVPAAFSAHCLYDLEEERTVVAGECRAKRAIDQSTLGVLSSPFK